MIEFFVTSVITLGWWINAVDNNKWLAKGYGALWILMASINIAVDIEEMIK